MDCLRYEPAGGKARRKDHARRVRAQYEPDGVGKLDGRIAPGDGLLAVAAAGAEEDPAEEGDVVVPADGGEAVGAVRTRLADTAMPWQSRDTHIQEAAKEQAK